jgi:hypothetical protein
MDSTGTLRTVYNNISVSISPDSVVLNGFGSTLVSGTVIVTATGGTTYAWSLVSSTGTGSLSFSNPTGSSTSLIATGLAEGEAFNGIARCTVNSVQSIEIPFYFYRFSTTSPDPDDPNFHEP